jgi:hypothetical protein
MEIPGVFYWRGAEELSKQGKVLSLNEVARNRPVSV